MEDMKTQLIDWVGVSPIATNGVAAHKMDSDTGVNNKDNGYVPPPKQSKSKSKPSPAPISPLFIHHVLEQIFQGAALSDLRNFRLVCREWSAVATRCLQCRLDFLTIGCRNTKHAHSLNYKNYVGTSYFTCTAASPDTLVSPSINAEQLKRFVEVISRSTNPPFTKYQISSSFFIPDNQMILHEFFKYASPFAQALKISLDNSAPGDFSPQFLANLTFPRMRCVMFEVVRQFTVCVDGGDETSCEIRDNAVSYRILSAISFGATSLESLEVSLQRKCDGEGHRKFNLDGTPNFERDRKAALGGGGTCPCQHFNMPDIFTPPDDDNVNAKAIEYFRSFGDMFNDDARKNGHGHADSNGALAVINRGNIDVSINGAASSYSFTLPTRKCHLPLPMNLEFLTSPPRISNSPKLKKLHLRLRNSFIHQNCITSLLERLAGTLEELYFTEEGHGSRVVLKFPVMKKLCKLTFSSVCEFEQNFVSILPFSYSEDLPRLCNLNLWDCFGTEKRYEALFASSASSYTVNKLVFPSHFRNVTLAQNIPKVFPKLKSLTMVFSARNDFLAVLETIFKRCGETLEELQLITDMDIQNQNVDHILTGLPKEICQKMRMDENYALPLHLQDMARRPSLLEMKALRKLMFQLEHKYSRAPLITDVTGYLAFMEMPHLEYLRFTRYGMSWSCCEELSKNFRVDILPPNGNNVFEIETFDFDFEGI